VAVGLVDPLPGEVHQVLEVVLAGEYLGVTAPPLCCHGKVLFYQRAVWV